MGKIEFEISILALIVSVREPKNFLKLNAVRVEVWMKASDLSILWSRSKQLEKSSASVFLLRRKAGKKIKHHGEETKDWFNLICNWPNWHDESLKDA